MKKMGERLRWVREALCLSQEAIAAKVGLHQTSWSLYERGERWPDQFEIVRLLAKLQISLAYLTDGDLRDVERELAIRIAARHPELVLPSGTVPRRDTLRP